MTTLRSPLLYICGSGLELLKHAAPALEYLQTRPFSSYKGSITCSSPSMFLSFHVILNKHSNTII